MRLVTDEERGTTAERAKGQPAGSLLGSLRRFLHRQLVQDVPADLHACELCRATECDSARYASCAYRLGVEHEERLNSRAEDVPRARRLRAAAE